MTACPVDPRKARPIDTGELAAGDEATYDAATESWRIGRWAQARTVLRESRSTVQAGFNAEQANGSRRAEKMRPPVLFQDGEEHRRQRGLIARYFAPKTVSQRYTDFLDLRSTELVDRMLERDEVQLSEVTMRLAVEVAAQVIGLESADMPAMSARLSTFFEQPASTSGPLGALRVLTARARTSTALLRFHRRDVTPAIAAKRRDPGDDVISHLLAQGASDAEILTECLTYGAAGMITTREFLCLAAWHLLDDAQLLADFRSADQERRHAILKEILRLEPIVGHLHRRATATVDIDSGDRVEPGAAIDVSVRAANLDPDVFGPDPLTLCPGRETPPGVPAEGMSFGDGPHRCPGNHLAIAETDAFLTRLFAHHVELLSTPTVTWNPLVTGYEIRGVRIRVSRGPRPPTVQAN